MNTINYQDYILEKLALHSRSNNNVTKNTPFYTELSEEQQSFVHIFYEFFDHSIGMQCDRLSNQAQQYKNIITAEQVYTSLERQGIMAIYFNASKDLNKTEKELLKNIYRLFPEAKKTQTLTMPDL